MPKITNLSIPNEGDKNTVLVPKGSVLSKEGHGESIRIEGKASLFYCFVNLRAVTNTMDPEITFKVEQSEDNVTFESVCDFETIKPEDGIGLFANAFFKTGKYVRMAWTFEGTGDYTIEAYMRAAA